MDSELATHVLIRFNNGCIIEAVGDKAVNAAGLISSVPSPGRGFEHFKTLRPSDDFTADPEIGAPNTID